MGPALAFNPFLYEALLHHIEGQMERWGQMAARARDTETADALHSKAEGLSYALRLLVAYEQEFQELVFRATGPGQDNETDGAAVCASPYRGRRGGHPDQ